MGVRLMVEVLDYAPANLTPRERWTLVVLAESARDTTRVCWPGIEDDDVFIRRCRLSRSQRYAVLRALIDKGALENVRRGQKHVRAGYRIAVMAPKGAKLPEPQDNPAPQHPDSQDAEKSAPGSQGPGFEGSGSRFSDLRVPVYRTPSPQSPQSPQKTQAAASDDTPPPKGTRGRQETLIDEPERTPEQQQRHRSKVRQRQVHALVDVYLEATSGMADKDKTRTVVEKAVDSGRYTHDQIAAGLRRVAQERKVSLHAEALRIAIDACINEQATAAGDNVIHLSTRSTTDQRVADGLALVAELEALEEGGNL